MPRAVPHRALTMLDFSQLTTPRAHGDVLVVPEPRACVEAVRRNERLLRAWDRPVASAPLSHWRKKTREALAGTDAAPDIVVAPAPSWR